MRFRDVPQIPSASYSTDVPWSWLQRWVDGLGCPLHLSPVYQRAHVWSTAQQSAYIEYVLRGGTSALTLYFNHPGWLDGAYETVPLECVDGKQRFTAVQAFLQNRVPAFRRHYAEYSDSLPGCACFHVKIATLQTTDEVIRWYLAINEGGTPHTENELARVRALLEQGENQ